MLKIDPRRRGRRRRKIGAAAAAFHGRPNSGRPSDAAPPPLGRETWSPQARSLARSIGFKVRFTTDARQRAFLDTLATFGKGESVVDRDRCEGLMRKRTPACTNRGCRVPQRSRQSLPVTLPPPMTPTLAETASALANADAHTTASRPSVVASGAQSECVSE